MKYYKHSDSIFTGPWHYTKKHEEMSQNYTLNIREEEVFAKSKSQIRRALKFKIDDVKLTSMLFRHPDPAMVSALGNPLLSRMDEVYLWGVPIQLGSRERQLAQSGIPEFVKMEI